MFERVSHVSLVRMVLPSRLENLCIINVLSSKLLQIVSGRHKLGMSALPHLTGVVVVFANQ
jgi:hypothetical protein